MTDKLKKLEFTLASDINNLKKIEQFVKQIARELHLKADEKDNLAIVLTEAAGNAIVHGNQSDPEKIVFIEAEIQPDLIVVTVTDEGTGFDPEALDDPLDPANLMKESGRGIFIMRTLAESIDYTFTDSGTILKITMQRRDSA